MIHNIKTENIHVEKDELLSSRVNLNEDQKAEVLQGLINKHVDKYDSDTLDVENNIIIINPRLYDDIDRYNQILRELPEQSIMWDYHTIFSTDVEFEIDYINKTVNLISGSGSDKESDLKLIITRHPIVDVIEFNEITEKKLTINIHSKLIGNFHIKITDDKDNILEDVDQIIGDKGVSFTHTELEQGLFKVIVTRNNATVIDQYIAYLGENETFDLYLNTTLKGTVYDLDSKEIISNVTVNIAQNGEIIDTVTSNENGEYSSDVVEKNSNIIATFINNDYIDVAADIMLSQNEYTFDCFMERNFVTVTGTIVDAINNQPVSNVELNIAVKTSKAKTKAKVKKANIQTLTTTSDKNGNFKFDKVVRYNNYTLTGVKDGFKDLSTELIITNEDLNVDLTMEEVFDYRVQGYVKDSKTNKPIIGALIDIYSVNDTWKSQIATTDEDGYYHILIDHDLIDQQGIVDYVIRASADKYAGYQEEFKITPNVLITEKNILLLEGDPTPKVLSMTWIDEAEYGYTGSEQPYKNDKADLEKYIYKYGLLQPDPFYGDVGPEDSYKRLIYEPEGLPKNVEYTYMSSRFGGGLTWATAFETYKNAFKSLIKNYPSALNLKVGLFVDNSGSLEIPHVFENCWDFNGTYDKNTIYNHSNEQVKEFCIWIFENYPQVTSITLNNASDEYWIRWTLNFIQQME